MARHLIFALGAAMAVALAGCGSDGTGRAQKIKDPYPAKVERNDIVGYNMLEQAAVYVPEDAQAVVYPKYNAPVEQVMVSVGQSVNRGEVLVQLNFPNAEVAYEQAQISVQEARSALESARSQYGEPVRQAKAALEEARRIERRLRDETDPDGDATALVQARQQREAAEAAVREAERYRDESVRAYQQQLVAAQEALEQAQKGVRLGSLRAPITGTVTFLDVQPGEVVGDNADKPLVKIVNLGAIKLKAHVAPEGAALIEEGKNVTIAFTEIPNKTFDGKVSQIQVLPTEDGDSTREVIIDFDNDKGQIKDGFTVDWVGVKVGEVKDVLSVPVDAVDKDDSGRPIVHVLQNEKWVPQVVETGLSNGRVIEIKSGLTEGQTVQVTPKK